MTKMFVYVTQLCKRNEYKMIYHYQMFNSRISISVFALETQY